jgi:hypothetical protein
MDDSSPDDDDLDPWGFDYEPDERQPSTAAIGVLAKDIKEITGIGGLLAMSTAILIDQGRSRLALELLDRELEARRERKREAAERRSQPGGRR